jgi:hypothetical protein
MKTGQFSINPLYDAYSAAFPFLERGQQVQAALFHL